jgi:transcriptional regulator with XRE-family HTH domain
MEWLDALGELRKEGERSPQRYWSVERQASGSETEIRQGEELGRLVAARRARLGLSQADLASIIDTSQSHVARIEEGQPPSTETAERLAAALNMEVGTWAYIRAVAIIAALYLSMIVVDGGGARIGLTAAAGGALWLSGIVARRGAATRILRPIAPATASGSGARTPWSSRGRRWLLGGLAIAVLVPVLVILGGRFFGTDGGDSSRQLPQAASAAPAAPLVGMEAQKRAPNTKNAAPQQDRGRRANEEAPGGSRSSSGAPRQAAPEPAGAGGGALAHTPRPKPPPAQSISPAPSPGSPSAPVHTTGKPVGSPGNGPGGSNAGGGNGPGGSNAGGGNGPGGTGPPGQMR